MSRERPTVTIFYDVPDWAFHNVARNVARIGARDYRFRLLGRDDWFGRPEVAAQAAQGSDIIVFLWRFDLLAFLDTVDRTLWSRIVGPERPAFVTVIYDHLYQSPEALAEYGDPFVLSDAVGACSERLRVQYAVEPHLPVPSRIVMDGVDLSRFSPEGRQQRNGGPLRIGWVGNSDWGATAGIDLKGMRTIFEPAIAMLEAGAPFELRIADRARRRLSPEDMPSFYHDLDVLVCTSAIEGTPNPILEAMASGVAVVTTDVGIVREVLGPEQSRFILRERMPEGLAAALSELITAPELVERLQRENLDRRDELAWEQRWPQWRALFQDAAAAASDPASVMEHTALLSAFRARRRTPMATLRRTVARNRASYGAYEIIRARYPKAIFGLKKVLEWGGR